MAVAASPRQAQAIRSEKPTGDQLCAGSSGGTAGDQPGRQRGQHPRRRRPIRREHGLQHSLGHKVAGAGGELAADDVPIEPAALKERPLDHPNASRQEQRGADPDRLQRPLADRRSR